MTIDCPWRKTNNNIMNEQTTDSCMRRRLAVLTVLTCWSSQHAGMPAVEASLSLQHRVQRAYRQVPYQHMLEGQPRGKFARVQHSLMTRTTFNDGQEPPSAHSRLHKEVHIDDTLWELHVTSSSSSSKNRRRKLGGGRDRGQEQRSQSLPSAPLSDLWRRLFDQFVGDPLPSEDTDLTANVTTEVEFGSVVSDINANKSTPSTNSTNANNNNNHDIDYTTEVGSANASTSTGNVTEAGNITESVVYTRPTVDGHNDLFGNNTNSSNSTINITQFQPLRIRAILAEDSGKGSLLNETERNSLFHDMLSPALLAWSSSLWVDPVVGNLTVDVHQLLDGETCGPGIDSGLPSIQVPLHHIKQGIPETDFIVYLSLGFVVSPLHRVKNTTIMGSFIQTSINEAEGGIGETNEGTDEELVAYGGENARNGMGSWINDLLYGGNRRRQRRLSSDSESSNGTVPPTTGERTDYWEDDQSESLNGTDTNSTEPINICTGEYLAAASYCSSDQYDRPTAALLHICIDDTFFDPKHLQRNILTLMHELGHALGFNSLSMAHFRRPDGTPYTPRDENGNVPYTEVECTGAETDHQIATVALPSEEILHFREVRGGVRVAEIVTPSVLQVVRNQFDCQLLTGAELESGEGLPLSVIGEEGCIGDHWERRLFSSDLMNPVVDDLEYSTRISTLTLAYFADSGWYQVDLSNAEVASGWGRGAGCSFVNDTCINHNGEVPPQNLPFFCNDVSAPGLSLTQDIHGCTPDLSRKATCSIGQYDLDLPPAYQYFNSTYGSDVGGSDTLMDFCPVYAGYDNGLCSNKDNEAAVKAFDVERFGQRNSRCLLGSVGPLFNQPTALCLPIACVIQDRSLRIKVDDSWHVCERLNQTITSASVSIACPDPRRVCPTFFCPYDCLGSDGQCDYETGKCLCEYINATGTGETVLDVCGMVEAVHDSEVSTLRPILQPQELGKNDPAVPPPNTKLSDYYVADEESLEDPPLLEAFAIALVVVTATLIVSFLSYVVYLRKTSNCGLMNIFDYFNFSWKNQDVTSDEVSMNTNREKDKMVATVLVDMRMHNNERWRRGRTQSLNDSLAETDDRLTESEVASGPEAMSDMSSRRSETLSDADISQNDINVEDLPPEVSEEPQVIRRRRVFTDGNV